MMYIRKAFSAANSGLRERFQAYSKSYAVTGVPFVQYASRSVKVYVFRSLEIVQLFAIAGCGVFLLSIRVNPSKTCSAMLRDTRSTVRAGSIVAGSAPSLYVTSWATAFADGTTDSPPNSDTRNTATKTSDSAFFIE